MSDMSSNAAYHWRLYGTLGCHLCTQAEHIVATLQQEFPINLEVVDIVDQPDWLAAYAQSIPVLENTLNGQQILWPFDPELLSDWLCASPPEQAPAKKSE